MQKIFNKRILIVDSDKDHLNFLSEHLCKEGYDVMTANYGRTALESAKQLPDLMILDILLPDMNGLDVIRELKQERSTEAISIIVLTIKDSDADEITVLEIGADDYLVKPVHLPRLLARIHTIFRRWQQSENGGPEREGIIALSDMEINTADYSVVIGGTSIEFPRKEFEILVFLVRNRGKVTKREAIFQGVWGTAVQKVDRTIDVHIGRIRKKLNGNAYMIETVPGVGYRFKVE